MTHIIQDTDQVDDTKPRGLHISKPTRAQHDEIIKLQRLGDVMVQDEHVEVFTNTFDDSIHEELKR